jgi:glycosyltransferase involved in cell wall biosynthesis
MSPLSVLGIVSYKVFPAQMGGQKCVVEWYAHLSAKTKLTLAVSKQNEPAGKLPYKVLPFLYNHWWGLLNLRWLYRLSRLIKEQSVNVIIIEHSYFGWLGILLRGLTQKPFVIRSHNIEALRFRDLGRNWWRFYEWYEKKVHQQADHSFFINEEDKRWALQHWRLAEKRCTVISHGTDIIQPVSRDETMPARERLILEHALPGNTRLFLFNGSLNYLPNLDALRIIVSELLPLLQAISSQFRIFVCGKGLSPQWEEALAAYPEIIYKGFVEDIEPYQTGIDCFINPVTLGGGIKIKLLEALAHNQAAVSTRTGARGISPELTAGKLVIVEDYNWPAFAKAMAGNDLNTQNDTPDAFYRAFNWDMIIQKALLSLQTL